MAEERTAKRRVEAWLASLGSANTRAAYRADLAVFIGWCQANEAPVLRATSETVERFRAALVAGGTRPSTAKRRAAAVHSFLRAHAGEGATVDRGRTDGVSTTHSLSAAERGALLGVLPRQSSKAQVLVAMLLLDGLKLDEVLGLEAEDISGRPPNLDVTVMRDDRLQQLRLHGSTSRIVGDHLAARHHGPLLGGRGAGSAHMSRFGADYLVKQLGRQAGLGVVLTTNMLRRSYVTEAHASGGRLEDIRWQVGHEDVQTTRRYLGAAAPCST